MTFNGHARPSSSCCKSITKASISCCFVLGGVWVGGRLVTDCSVVEEQNEVKGRIFVSWLAGDEDVGS